MTSDEVFEAISHPRRIEILKLLVRSPIGFADLKRKLKIDSSGLLDFHLRKMADIITTNGKGLYILNEQGYAAAQAVDVVSRYGWQRRAFMINTAVYIIMNTYFFLILVNTYFYLWLLILGITTVWIVFYSYWTFIKRGVRLRQDGDE